MKKLLFIINPISGGKDKRGFPGIVETHLDKSIYTNECVFTERPGHAYEIAKAAIEKDYYAVVAVGGDGTINEVASAIVQSKMPMGIVPCGSGNGLALSLGLSLDNKEAVKALKNFHPKAIDAGRVNGEWFFNMAGMGFDAHISHAFAELPSRGFVGYIRTAIREVLRYTPFLYDIYVDDKHLQRVAFMVSIANSSQYGNNAHISPSASLEDGLLDVCVVKPFALWRFPGLVWRMFTKRAEGTSFLEIIKGKKIRIISKDNPKIHLDGEPKLMQGEIYVEIVPSVILILC